MRQKDVSQVSLPNSLVRDPTIKPLEFCILLRFKFMEYLQKSSKIEVEISELMAILHINDRRTIKTAFNNLIIQQYIVNEIVYQRNRPVMVCLNTKKIAHGNNFTMLPTYLINKIKIIGHTGLRLLYYYQSYINNRSSSKRFAHPGFKRICSETSINQDTLNKYNNVLVDEKLLKIQKFDPEYFENCEGGNSVERCCNHYDVRLDRMFDKAQKIP